jgi:hypothetical protein
LLLSLLTCFVAMAANAAPVSPAAKAEIDGLLVRLEASVCEFNRNGSWYTAAEAKTHLLRKLNVCSLDFVRPVSAVLNPRLGSPAAAQGIEKTSIQCPSLPDSGSQSRLVSIDSAY